MPTRLTVRQTPVGTGAAHLVADLEHATIPLERDRKVWLLSVVVITDLHPDPDEDANNGP
jgi:hypothetical protein